MSGKPILLRPIAAPSISSAVPSTEAKGTLTNGRTYGYGAAMRNARGDWSASSGAVSCVADTAGAIRLIGTTDGFGLLVLCRADVTGGGDPLASPDRFVAMPWMGRNFRFSDYGNHVGKVPWQTANVPVLSSVAAANHTTRGILIDQAAGLVMWPKLSAAATGNLVKTNDAVLANVPGCAIPVEAFATYWVEAFVYYDASTNGDIQVGWSTPAGRSGHWGGMRLATTASSSPGTISCSASIWTGALAAGGVGLGTFLHMKLAGQLITGSAAGVLQLQAAQNASDAGATTVYAPDTIITAQRVA